MATLTPQGRKHRRGVFALTWTSYASYYFVRKNLPVAKTEISRELGIGVNGLADLDTVFLTVYALGQFCGGWLGDKLGARRLVGYGMLASAAFCAAFGSSSTFALLALFLALDGFFEATGWPGTIKAMAAWFGPKERGKVMGLWSTCFQVGPIVATALAARLIHLWGWRSAFFVPACLVAVVGLVVLRFLRETPRQEDLEPEVHGERDPGEDGSGGGLQSLSAKLDPEMVRRARAKVLANPVVWMLGLSYFGMKLIRYCIDFWSPYFLEKSLGYSAERAAYISTALQFGGIIGAVAIGAISDRWFPKRRGAVAAVTTLVLAGSLALYAKTAALGMGINIAGLALVGFCLFGPDALISGVAAQDLGGPYAAATVAGIINGFGSVGAIAQGRLFAYVNTQYGWQTLFHVLMVLALIAAVGLGAVGIVQARQDKASGEVTT